jgi:hypothetical protein
VDADHGEPVECEPAQDDDVGAASDTAVKGDPGLVADGVGNTRKVIEGGGEAIELTAAVVGDAIVDFLGRAG